MHTSEAHAVCGGLRRGGAGELFLLGEAGGKDLEV